MLRESVKVAASKDVSKEKAAEIVSGAPLDVLKGLKAA